MDGTSTCLCIVGGLGSSGRKTSTPLCKDHRSNLIRGLKDCIGYCRSIPHLQEDRHQDHSTHSSWLRHTLDQDRLHCIQIWDLGRKSQIQEDRFLQHSERSSLQDIPLGTEEHFRNFLPLMDTHTCNHIETSLSHIQKDICMPSHHYPTPTNRLCNCTKEHPLHYYCWQYSNSMECRFLHLIVGMAQHSQPEG